MTRKMQRELQQRKLVAYSRKLCKVLGLPKPLIDEGYAYVMRRQAIREWHKLFRGTVFTYSYWEQAFVDEENGIKCYLVSPADTVVFNLEIAVYQP